MAWKKLPPPKWQHWRINATLMGLLFLEYDHQEFTLKQAYEVHKKWKVEHPERTGYMYTVEDHDEEGNYVWSKRPYSSEDVQERLERDPVWHNMNVRNSLCAMVYHRPELFERVRPGVYRFTAPTTTVVNWLCYFSREWRR